MSYLDIHLPSSASPPPLLPLLNKSPPLSHPRPSRDVASAGGSANVEAQPPRRWAGPSSPNFGVEGVDEVVGFKTEGSTVGTFLSKLTD